MFLSFFGSLILLICLPKWYNLTGYFLLSFTIYYYVSYKYYLWEIYQKN